MRPRRSRGVRLPRRPPAGERSKAGRLTRMKRPLRPALYRRGTDSGRLRVQCAQPLSSVPHLPGGRRGWILQLGILGGSVPSSSISTTSSPWSRPRPQYLLFRAASFVVPGTPGGKLQVLGSLAQDRYNLAGPHGRSPTIEQSRRETSLRPPRRAATSSSAASGERASVRTRYAATTATDLPVPWWQWTTTVA